MNVKSYKSFIEIENDLKMLSLEKQIAFEELKVVKNNFENQLKPLSLLASFAKFAGKYSLLVLVKRIFK
ncbi:DUF6327 family protein [uncultured Polaribacter sp.]|uniref:DUF6327 family protein n=1 Tax=uncultured Polaribacter sp. TaxID=174711 RepID=UPI0026396530|nr:DUF6327 family protein [uncultured Polaribacter sp.]